ncbi:hypothetical protein SGLAM104S_02880 [Streptomyces glaucescens]
MVEPSCPLNATRPCGPTAAATNDTVPSTSWFRMSWTCRRRPSAPIIAAVALRGLLHRVCGDAEPGGPYGVLCGLFGRPVGQGTGDRQSFLCVRVVPGPLPRRPADEHQHRHEEEEQRTVLPALAPLFLEEDLDLHVVDGRGQLADDGVGAGQEECPPAAGGADDACTAAGPPTSAPVRRSRGARAGRRRTRRRSPRSPRPTSDVRRCGRADATAGACLAPPRDLAIRPRGSGGFGRGEQDQRAGRGESPS